MMVVVETAENNIFEYYVLIGRFMMSEDERDKNS